MQRIAAGAALIFLAACENLTGPIASELRRHAYVDEEAIAFLAGMRGAEAGEPLSGVVVFECPNPEFEDDCESDEGGTTGSYLTYSGSYSAMGTFVYTATTKTWQPAAFTVSHAMQVTFSGWQDTWVTPPVWANYQTTTSLAVDGELCDGMEVQGNTVHYINGGSLVGYSGASGGCQNREN